MPPPPTVGQETVLALLNSRSRHLFKNLPLAMAGEAEPVHQVRVASRRLRVLLEIITKKPGGRRARGARRRLRSLARTAGSYRDIDVALALFDREISHRGPRTPVVASLRRRLSAARGAARRSMSGSLLDLNISGLRADLAAIAARGLCDLFTACARLQRTGAEQREELLGSLTRLGGRFDAEALHDLRSRVRRARYAAEVNAALLGNAADAPRRLKDAQAFLGEIHDAWLLAAWLGRQAEASERRERTVESAEVRRLQAHFADLAREVHSRFLETAPEAGLRRVLSSIARRSVVRPVEGGEPRERRGWSAGVRPQ